MALSTNDILKVVVSMALPDSVVAQQVFWLLFENTGGSADEDDVIDDIEDYVEGMYGRILGTWSDLVSLDEMKVYVYDSTDDDFDEVGGSVITGVGTQATELQAHGLAIVSNALTTDPDVYGRKFWPGICEGFVADGYLASPGIAPYALATGDWITNFTGATSGSDFQPGVYSLTKTAFFAFGDDVTTNLLLGYQRRRKPGVGI